MWPATGMLIWDILISHTEENVYGKEQFVFVVFLNYKINILEKKTKYNIQKDFKKTGKKVK